MQTESTKSIQANKTDSAPSRLPRPSSRTGGFKVPALPDKAKPSAPSKLLHAISKKPTAIGNPISTRTLLGAKGSQGTSARSLEKGKGKADPTPPGPPKKDAFALLMQNRPASKAPPGGPGASLSANGSSRTSAASSIGQAPRGGIKDKMRKREKPKPVGNPFVVVPEQEPELKAEFSSSNGNDDSKGERKPAVASMSTESDLAPMSNEMARNEEDSGVVAPPATRAPQDIVETPVAEQESGGDPMDEDDLFGGPLSPVDDMVLDPLLTSDGVVASGESANLTPAEEIPPPVLHQAPRFESPQPTNDVEMTDATELSTEAPVGQDEVPSANQLPKSNSKRRMPTSVPPRSRATRSTSSLKRKAEAQPDEEPGMS